MLKLNRLYTTIFRAQSSLAAPFKTVEIVKNDKPLKFVIQPVPEDRYEEAADHMCKFFVADEPLLKGENVKDDPEAKREIKSLFENALEDNLSVAAFTEKPEGGKSTMAAVNVLYRGGKNQRVDFSKFMCNSDKIRRVMQVMGTLGDVDTEKLYGCDEYIGGCGVSVDPDFRGNAIGYHLLMARHDIGKRNNLRATITVFTSPISTKLAIRAGFEVLTKKLRDELVDANGQLLAPRCKTEIFLCMGKKLD